MRVEVPRCHDKDTERRRQRQLAEEERLIGEQEKLLGMEKKMWRDRRDRQRRRDEPKERRRSDDSDGDPRRGDDRRAKLPPGEGRERRPTGGDGTGVGDRRRRGGEREGKPHDVSRGRKHRDGEGRNHSKGANLTPRDEEQRVRDERKKRDLAGRFDLEHQSKARLKGRFNRLTDNSSDSYIYRT